MTTTTPSTTTPTTATSATATPTTAAATQGATPREVLDPTSEAEPAVFTTVARPASLDGLTIGLLDISKARGDVFLDRIAERAQQRGLAVERFRKPTFAKPAPVDLRHEIATRCDVVIEALAD